MIVALLAVVAGIIALGLLFYGPRAARLTIALAALSVFAWGMLSGMAQERPAGRFALGRVFVLTSPDKEPVAAATDEATEKEFQRLAAANDDLGITRLVEVGRVLLLLPGTRVRVIDSKYFWGGPYQVRILEGPSLGEAVWVQGSLLRGPKRL